MDTIIWFDDLGRGAVDVAGGKGANLGELTRAGLPVPPGFVISTGGYDWFVYDAALQDWIVDLARSVPPNDTDLAEAVSAQIHELFATAEMPAELADRITRSYLDLTGHDDAAPDQRAVAVRSSATAEDLAGASFAGQQDTYLNVVGPEEVLDAVRRCWASLWTARAIAYRQREGIDPATVKLAVVIQKLVDAESAGVMFTANPINGRRDEVVISAAWGLGESVVGGTVGTDSLVVQSGPDHPLRVVSAEVGDKQVRTVRTEHGTDEVEADADQRRRSVLTDVEAVELSALGLRIAQHYDQPMDIEWARADSTFWIVQARPITALPDPVGPAPTDWSVPDPRTLYARASIIEQLPDPLTPLFGDMIQPAVAGSLRKLVQSVFGSELPPGGLTFPLINGYAYYAYTWPVLARMSAITPRLLPKLFGHADGNAEQRWRDDFRPRYRAEVHRWATADHDQLDATTILQAVTDLLFAGAEYYTSVQMIIPIAAGTESLFTRIYDTTLRRDGDPEAATFVMGTDSSPMRAERALYDVARWCTEHPEVLAALSTDAAADALAFGPAPAGVSQEMWTGWQERIGDYLDTYGHAVYNLDFANPVAADAPGPVLDTIRFYATGRADGTAVEDPRVRQNRLAGERERATADLLARLDPIRRRLIAPLLTRAQEIAPVREDALADVGLAWPTIRRLLTQLGQRLVAAGAIRRADDVYWLRLDEVTTMTAALDRGTGEVPAPVAAAKIDQRKLEWRGQRSVTPPQLLPDSPGNHLMDRWMPSHTGDQTGPVLTGLGASGGTVTAEAHLITDQSDFATMQPGRVLVAKITTPAYTPLFALASGVVTDVGGPLSHSSIVAREYGIPAVLGTGVATQRISTGQTITVDGTAGRVILDSVVGGTPSVSAPARPPTRSARVAAVLGAVVGAVAVVGVVRLITRRRRRRPT